MNTIHIQYCFRIAEDKQEVFNLEFDAYGLELVGNTPETLPSWTRLDFHQCPNCPLSIGIHPHCPLSVNLIDIVRRFGSVVSYDKVRVDVVTDERIISQDTTAQRGLSSLMGLIIATSGCPHTVFFKPMARFHLPLASEEETLYRATSMYLLAQYFVKAEGKEPDCELNGLKKIYGNIQLVNAGIAERLKIASKTDSSANAVTRLDLFAKIVPFFVQDNLENLRHLFKPYLE